MQTSENSTDPGMIDDLNRLRFFDDMDPADLSLLAGCGKHMTFTPNQVLARSGSPAHTFMLILDGHVMVEMMVPGQENHAIQSLSEGDCLGWSWLIPPHVWKFDARATWAGRAIAFDGRALREMCNQDPRLGFDLLRRITMVMSTRLTATRMQLLELGESGVLGDPD